MREWELQQGRVLTIRPIIWGAASNYSVDLPVLRGQMGSRMTRRTQKSAENEDGFDWKSETHKVGFFFGFHFIVKFTLFSTALYVYVSMVVAFCCTSTA